MCVMVHTEGGVDVCEGAERGVMMCVIVHRGERWMGLRG